MTLVDLPAAGDKIYGSVFAQAITELRPLYVRKLLNEGVTSSAALQDDNELLLPVIANATYSGLLVALIQSAANAAGDIAIGFSFPSLSTLYFSGSGPHNSLASGSSADGEWIARPGATSGVTSTPFGCSTSANTVTIEIDLVTGANAGNLTTMWAQQASNANESRMLAGSKLILKRVA